MNGATLIMDLTREQGGSRVQQVQPPKAIWVRYFLVDLDDIANLPTFDLRNRSGRRRGRLESRRVVYHDHNWTIEINEPTQPLPAILRVVRTGQNSFDYWVYRDPQPEFAHCDWILSQIPNPYRTHGRRWVIL